MKNLILIVVALLCFACDKKSDQDKLSDETTDVIAGRWHSARYAEDENFTVNVKSTDEGEACFAGTTLEFKKDRTFKEIRPCENGKIITGKFKVGERSDTRKNSIYVKLYNPNNDALELQPDIMFSPKLYTSVLYLYKYTDSTLIFYVRDAPKEWYYEFKRVQ